MEQNKYSLRFNPEKMTLGDMCTLERPTSFIEIREALAKHIVNGANEWINEELARNIVSEIPRPEMQDWINGLWEQINSEGDEDFTEKKGSPSINLLLTESMTEASQDG